jgi:HD superfamily phosphohydrolase
MFMLFDADRLDYMRRDRLMTGSRHAGIDFEWLMENLEVAEVEHGVDQTKLKPVQTFVLGRKAIFAAEAYVLGLFQLYPTVYFHKATRGAEKIYTELLARAITLIKDGSIKKTGLPNTHPLVKFAQKPDGIESALALDDTVIWGALSLMSDSDDECVSKLAERMRDRKLYKCIDVRAKIAHDKNDSAASSSEADTVCAAIRDELGTCLDEWSSKCPDAPPRILIDEVERSPYNLTTEDAKGPLNQINIRTEGDHLVDLAKRSNVVAELETYKAFRVYHADGDDEAKGRITEIINGGIQKWPA